MQTCQIFNQETPVGAAFCRPQLSPKTIPPRQKNIAHDTAKRKGEIVLPCGTGKPVPYNRSASVKNKKISKTSRKI